MITSLDARSELFLANLAHVQDRLTEANRLVSSGKRIASASDAPDEIEPLLQVLALRQHNTQLLNNLNLSKADADSADGALTNAIKLMDRAAVLATQAANFTQTAASRQDLAREVQALQEEMVACSQTSVDGRYIFSGDGSDGPAYTFDVNSDNNGVVQSSNAAATTRIEDPAGGTFAGSKTAQEIFDLRDGTGAVVSGNVFAALNQLRVALTTNDGISDAAAMIDVASKHLNSMQSFYGAVQSRIQDAIDGGNRRDVQFQKEISQRQDADVVSAALELSSANTQMQAAMQMQAKMPHTSLFDYLG
jgi:flagellar hook-associated protein 3 FlgL